MRLGCLPYLNVKPLVYSLEHGELPRGWELVYAPPARLAEMLVAGQIAAAPVSSFATFAYPELEICPGICIAADGPVKSVLMLSKKEAQTIDTVALDPGSLSGASMLRIILEEAYGLRPDYVCLPPQSVPEMLDLCDAALVIGNPAMLCAKDGLHVMDIGHQWRTLTGLPAVFALWAGTQITPELVDVLHDAKQHGMARLDEIARDQSAQLGLPFETCDEYLSRIMVYDLGEREALGLKVFRDKAIEHSLIPPRAGQPAAHLP